MISEIAFDIGMQDFSIHQLMSEDINAIQVLFEHSSDYMILIDGHPADNNAAEEALKDMPPGTLQDDKFLFGITDQRNQIIGLLDAVRRYPDPTTWWIGLLLLAPDARSQGIGKQVLEGFARHVKAHEGKAIMLGVVDENRRAYAFWEEMGFELVRKTEPRPFGSKTHSISVMRKTL